MKKTIGHFVVSALLVLGIALPAAAAGPVERSSWGRRVLDELISIAGRYFPLDAFVHQARTTPGRSHRFGNDMGLDGTPGVILGKGPTVVPAPGGVARFGNDLDPGGTPESSPSDGPTVAVPGEGSGPSGP